ncbi:MAG: outer membrane beta-barrel domain-containing protein [Deltaproteobacteria bacterium]|nr:MAG: outer membrane beta-barrel domain-containing protein [Deltaproteobacteria bacterium]
MVTARVAVAVALVLLGPSSAKAQDKEDDDAEMTFETDEASEQPSTDEPAPPDEGDTGDLGGDDLGLDLDAGTGSKAAKAAAKEEKLGESRVSWQDIVVVVRKPFLKVHRVELLPTYGVTMNDNIIQHHMFGGSINYFLTDVLAVGVEGQYFVKNLREPFDLVARQARRLPTVNKYKYGASVNFHYVPIYGKFAVLDEHIVHWESFFTLGVGFTQTEVIPRDPALLPFDNFLITPNVGMAMRFFITKFITVHVGIRDYVFLDKFESTDRTAPSPPDQARNEADSSLVNNVMFQAGVSFWFPTSFEYTTFR